VLRWDNSHDLVSEFSKQGSLSGLRHKISDHVAGGAPLDCEFLLFDSIRYKVVADVDMLRAFTAQGLAIPFQEHGTTIVLIDNVLMDLPSLCLDEISRPADCWHAVVDCN
jgi:hypothetical protein